MSDKITVHIPGELRSQVGDQTEIQVAGASVGAVLSSLAESYPVLGRRLFTGEGQINRFVNIYLDDEDIRFLENLDTGLKGGEEISIVPAIAGG
jgi:molybdopterin converting factor small subunit